MTTIKNPININSARIACSPWWVIKQAMYRMKYFQFLENMIYQIALRMRKKINTSSQKKDESGFNTFFLWFWLLFTLDYILELKFWKEEKESQCDHIPFSILACVFTVVFFFFYHRLSSCIIVILSIISFTGFSNENILNIFYFRK